MKQKSSKRIFSMLLALLIPTCLLLSLSAMASPAEPVITMEPQSPNYPEYSVAMYRTTLNVNEPK